MVWSFWALFRTAPGSPRVSRWSQLLLVCLVICFIARGNAQSEELEQEDVCGFKVLSSKVSRCSNKPRCDKLCQLGLCRGLVKFNQVVDWQLSNASKFNYPNASSLWFDDVALCNTMEEEFQYCRWYGVSCCCLDHHMQPRSNGSCEWCEAVNSSKIGAVSELSLRGLGLNGSLPSSLLHLSALGLHGLLTLRLQSNNFYGELLQGIAALFPELIRLNLGSNTEVTGRIPPGVASLANLEEFNMEYTKVSGTVPLFCPEEGSSKLADVFLRGTLLSGSVNESFRYCSELVSLNLQDNNFTGHIPTSARWHNLHILRLQNNQFSGTIPEELYTTQFLMTLDVSGNNLTGNISELIYNLEYLSSLRAADNELSGSLPDGLFYLAQLSLLDLSGNDITGTLPESFGNATGLTDFNIANTKVSGIIPESVRSLRFLRHFNIQNTRMFCCSDSQQCNYDSQDSCLPSFLQFQKDTSVPPPYDLSTRVQTDETGYYMKCNHIALKTYAGSHPISGGKRRLLAAYQNLPLPPLLPPFPISSNSGRRFLLGLHRTSLQEQESQVPAPTAPIVTAFQQQKPPDSVKHTGNAATIPSTAPALPKTISRLAELYDRVKPRATFMPGMLEGGPLTSAQKEGVWLSSDVIWLMDPDYYNFTTCSCDQGYYGVWNTTFYNGSVRAPGSAARVCLLEGRDSIWSAQVITVTTVGGFLVLCAVLVLLVNAFRPKGYRSAAKRAWDHVKWRLQGMPKSGVISVVVTDIEGYSDLMKSSPELMTQCLNVHNGVMRKVRWENCGFTVEQEGDSFTFVFYTAVDAAAFCLQAQQALMKVEWPAGLAAAGLLHTTQTSGSRRSIFSKPGWLLRKAPPESPAAAGAADAQMGCWGAMLGRTLSTQFADVTQPSGSSQDNIIAAHAGHPGSSSASESVGAVPLLTSTVPLFHGLRVRMGVATGSLLPGQDIKNAAVVDLAKAISDMGCGGQVLLCERTFADVKERLRELGAVDAAGINWKKLRSGRRGMWARITCRPKQQSRLDEEALVLDMGQYTMPPGLGAAAAAVARSSRRNPCSPPPQLPQQQQPQGDGYGHYLRLPGFGGFWSRAAAMRSFRVPEAPCSGDDQLRVVQLLAPALVGRAKVFGNSLALRADMRCEDMPYFDAPGTMAAPLGPERCAPVPMPEVTMVFCIVDGTKKLRWKRADSRQEVHSLLARALRRTLRVSRGGYLCREQPGDLKYMLAFDSPRAALEWCLLMQAAALRLPWPADVLALAPFAQEEDAAGSVVFRGPRLKMGLCSGVPKSILPDHLGRADYHGATVNQAARYMDAGAHGGQVVCELATALGVLREWGALQGSTEKLLAAACSSICESGSRAHQPQLAQESSGWGSARHSRSSGDDTAHEAAAAAAGGGGEGAAEALRSPSSSSVSTATPRHTAQHEPLTSTAAPAKLAAAAAAAAAAAPVTCPASAQRSPFHRPPSALSPHTVQVHRLGLFKFKGSPEPTQLVQVVLSSLAGRRYPADPPRGKGSRLEEHSGLLAAAAVELPQLPGGDDDDDHDDHGACASKRGLQQQEVELVVRHLPAAAAAARGAAAVDDTGEQQQQDQSQR